MKDIKIITTLFCIHFSVVGFCAAQEKPEAIPKFVVRAMEDGILNDHFTILRRTLRPNSTFDLNSIPKENSWQVTNYLSVVSNRFSVLYYDEEVGLVEETTLTGLPGLVAGTNQWGWTKNVAWKRDGGETPWVVSLSESRAPGDRYAGPILKVSDVMKKSVLAYQTGFSIDGLVGYTFKYDPVNKEFMGQSGGHKVELKAEWDGDFLRLWFNRIFSNNMSVPCLAVLKIEKIADTHGRVNSVKLYTVRDDRDRDPKPWALLSDVEITTDETNGVTREEASNADKLFGWKDCQEFVDGKWRLRNVSGKVADLPIHNGTKSHGLKIVLLVLTSSAAGFFALLLRRRSII